jgi:uncharacterized protein (DUF4415 family)
MGLWEQMQRADAKKAVTAKPALAKPAPKPVEPIKSAAPASGQKRGPKPSGSAKKLISLRLDQDVIDGFKSTGEGWQARMNTVLRTHLKL